MPKQSKLTTEILETQDKINEVFLTEDSRENQKLLIWEIVAQKIRRALPDFLQRNLHTIFVMIASVCTTSLVFLLLLTPSIVFNVSNLEALQNLSSISSATTLPVSQPGTDVAQLINQIQSLADKERFLREVATGIGKGLVEKTPPLVQNDYFVLNLDTFTYSKHAQLAYFDSKHREKSVLYRPTLSDSFYKSVAKYSQRTLQLNDSEFEIYISSQHMAYFLEHYVKNY